MLVYNIGDLSGVVGVEDDVAGEVLRLPGLGLLLRLAVRAAAAGGPGDGGDGGAGAGGATAPATAPALPARAAVPLARLPLLVRLHTHNGLQITHHCRRCKLCSKVNVK